MHYTTLINLPATILEDKNDYILEIINIDNCNYKYAVEPEIGNILKPFDENGEEYMVFKDKTDELRTEYDTEKRDLIRLRNGSLIFPGQMDGTHKYKIGNNNKVYEIVGDIFDKRAYCAGPIHPSIICNLKLKRTKRAKKLKVMTGYPMNKLYKTFEDFTCFHCGYKRGEPLGYDYNPNEKWDWYSIGGRWDDTFLVKSEYKRISLSDDNTTNYAPKGYAWLPCAKKCDIEWDMMKDIYEKMGRERFNKLENFFKNPDLRGEYHIPQYTNIVEDGIVTFGDYEYIKDESFEDYIKREYLFINNKYSFTSYAFIKDGVWNEKDLQNETQQEWDQKIQEHIDSLPDDEILCIVDYHI